MNKNKWDDNKIIDYVDIKTNEITDLPNGISISTMCASCNLNTKIDIGNIEKYLQLNSDDIFTIKFNNDRIKTLAPLKNNSKRLHKIETKKNTGNHFYNQITVIIRVTQGPTKDLNKEPRINMKLFKNGAVQMSGCKSIYNINYALNKLIFRLKEIKAKIEDGKIIEKLFIEDVSKITITKFKIDMINTNYKVNMQIDREKLYNLLLMKKIKSSYEPCIRACIIIKYLPENSQKDVSIFVFQKGNIIITGAKSKIHVIMAFNYINNILLTHTNEIIKNNEKEEEDIILNIYKSIMKEVDIGLIKI